MMLTTSKTHNYPQGLRVASRFLTVGTLSTLLDIALFSALRGVLGLPSVSANLVSYSAGMLNSFRLHRRWTYAHRPQRALTTQFARFIFVSLGALLLNSLLLSLLAPSVALLVAGAADGDVIAKLLATAGGLCWNLVFNSVWTFRETGALQ